MLSKIRIALALCAALLTFTVLVPGPAMADEAETVSLASYEALLSRLEAVEAEMREIRDERQAQPAPARTPLLPDVAAGGSGGGYYFQAEVITLKAFSEDGTAGVIDDSYVRRGVTSSIAYFDGMSSTFREADKNWVFVVELRFRNTVCEPRERAT